jgi:uncharacterized LabA/DUF88 family protein
MDDKAEKIYAFIDSQNLNLSVLKDIINLEGKVIYHGWKLDFARFFIYIRDKYRVEKAFLFIGRVDGYESLYSYLEQAGYQIIFKPTLKYTDGKEKIIKGNVDAELVLHTMIEFPNYSKAIIVAGDGDYYCLIEYLEKQHKLSHVIIPNEISYSSLLIEFRKYFVYVTNLREKLEHKTN